jgi:hypothetical protein
MATAPSSSIRHEVQQLMQTQIDILRLESSPTSSQLGPYHSRWQRIAAQYRELDQNRRDRTTYELRTASGTALRLRGFDRHPRFAAPTVDGGFPLKDNEVTDQL